MKEIHEWMNQNSSLTQGSPSHYHLYDVWRRQGIFRCMQEHMMMIKKIWMSCNEWMMTELTREQRGEMWDEYIVVKWGNWVLFSHWFFLQTNKSQNMRLCEQIGIKKLTQIFTQPPTTQNVYFSKLYFLINTHLKKLFTQILKTQVFKHDLLITVRYCNLCAWLM